MAQPPVKQNAKTPAEIFEKLRLPTAVWWLREAVAIVFSVAIITHLFFFNVVHYVGEKFPITGPFVQYVPLYILGITALLWANVELFGSLVILILFVFLVLTLIRERYNQDLDQVVTHIGNVSAEVGEFLESNYDVTLAGAEALLFRVNPLVAKWLLHLRYGATRALEMSKEFDAEIGLADEDNTELLSSPTKGTEEN